jgi:thiamine-monophosphate kinase
MEGLREEKLIEIFSSFFTSHPRIQVGPGDDATILTEIPGRVLVFSIDAQFEGIHFERDFMSLRDIGHRALASALSDLAAMASLPLTYLVNIEFPPDIGEKGASEIYEGFRKLNERYCISPSGGNVVRGEKLSLVIAVLGEGFRERVLKRKGAREGDRVVVTGDLGRSLAGYKILKNPVIGEHLNPEEKASLREKFLNPWPRIFEILELIKEMEIHGAIDISDGLGIDLYRTVKEDSFEILIDAEKLPIHQSVFKLAEKIGIEPWKLAVSSGEEYEVAMFIPESEIGKLRKFTFPLTVIGEIQPSFRPDVKVKTKEGDFSIKNMGYDQLRTDKNMI